MASVKRPAPSYEEWLSGVAAPSREVIRALDAQALSFPGVTREVHWDGLARDFTPSYKMGGRELFHVHPSDGGAGITLSVSVKKLEPLIASDPAIPEPLRRQVLSSRDYRGTRWAFLSCPTVEDAGKLRPLLRCKAEWIARETRP
jgi:hypothetical protein